MTCFYMLSFDGREVIFKRSVSSSLEESTDYNEAAYRDGEDWRHRSGGIEGFVVKPMPRADHGCYRSLAGVRVAVLDELVHQRRLTFRVEG